MSDLEYSDMFVLCIRLLYLHELEEPAAGVSNHNLAHTDELFRRDKYLTNVFLFSIQSLQSRWPHAKLLVRFTTIFRSRLGQYFGRSNEEMTSVWYLSSKVKRI